MHDVHIIIISFWQTIEYCVRFQFRSKCYYIVWLVLSFTSLRPFSFYSLYLLLARLFSNAIKNNSPESRLSMLFCMDVMMPSNNVCIVHHVNMKQSLCTEMMEHLNTSNKLIVPRRTTERSLYEKLVF